MCVWVYACERVRVRVCLGARAEVCVRACTCVGTSLCLCPCMILYIILYVLSYNTFLYTLYNINDERLRNFVLYLCLCLHEMQRGVWRFRITYYEHFLYFTSKVKIIKNHHANGLGCISLSTTRISSIVLIKEIALSSSSFPSSSLLFHLIPSLDYLSSFPLPPPFPPVAKISKHQNKLKTRTTTTKTPTITTTEHERRKAEIF